MASSTTLLDANDWDRRWFRGSRQHGRLAMSDPTAPDFRLEQLGSDGRCHGESSGDSRGVCNAADPGCVLGRFGDIASSQAVAATSIVDLKGSWDHFVHRRWAEEETVAVGKAQKGRQRQNSARRFQPQPQSEAAAFGVCWRSRSAHLPIMSSKHHQQMVVETSQDTGSPLARSAQWVVSRRYTKK